MLFCEVNLATRRLLNVTVWVTLGFSAAAQQTIQFTKPVDKDDSSSKANAFMPEKAHRNPADFNAPTPLFGNQGPSVSFDVLPGSPQRVFPNANAAEWQKSLNDKKNWALMTPEEILGIPTPEKILGIPDPKDDPKLSAEERFLQREEQQSIIGASNALHRANASVWQKNDLNSEHFQTDAQSRFAGTVDGSVPGTTRGLNAFFRQSQDGVADANQNLDSAWTSPFNSPVPPPKPTPEQLAGMDRFRALLEPPAQDKASQVSQPVITPDPNMQVVPVFNPAGQSFTALRNNASLPVGIMPLPGVTGPPPTVAKTPPLVQPPPWMQSPLQSGIMPQRQF